MADPRILIFDEATSALDAESEEIIQRNMQAIVQGRTVIVIAHRLSAVRIADRIVAMDQGRLVEDGTHAELLARGGRYADLWRRQVGSHPSSPSEARGGVRVADGGVMNRSQRSDPSGPLGHLATRARGEEGDSRREPRTISGKAQP